jgi:HSP20 family protein
MNSLFELPMMGNLTRQAQLFSGWTPALDLYQDNDNVVATVELPGMRKEDIDISLHDGVLTIAGERPADLPSEEGGKAAVHINERFSGRFRRVISLSEDVDPNGVSATYLDGILHVTAKRRESAQPRRINVQ